MSNKRRRTPARGPQSYSSSSSQGDPITESAGHRQARLEHILLDEFQALLRDEATDPRLEGLRLLTVQLSPDGGHARVGYSVAATFTFVGLLADSAGAPTGGAPCRE